MNAETTPLSAEATKKDICEWLSDVKCPDCGEVLKPVFLDSKFLIYSECPVCGRAWAF
jgi:ssDNA-binding Zn-finger/Zn-ribbon topoisomerase 1